MAETAKLQFSWKRRPSEIKGYDRAMYTTLDNGDYIRVDYNLADSMARIYVEVDGDRNSPYFAVINNGRVTLERNNSGRSSKVAEIISNRSSQFSSIPNREILKIINRNYGIFDEDAAEKTAEKKAADINREEIKQRYFKKESNPYNAQTPASVPYTPGRFSVLDVLDILTGIVIAAGTFILFGYSFLAAGAASVFWGLILGFIDIMIREREPVFIKIILFLFGGAFAYIYGYFYY